MQSALPMPLLTVLVPLLVLSLGLEAAARVSIANPAIKPLSQRGIIFPKESYDDCFTDEGKTVAGTCKLIEDCPSALNLWQTEKVLPKTCYFVKYDQYVCCEQTLTVTEIPTAPPTPSPPPTRPTLPTLPMLVQRPSERACEGARVFGVSIVGGRPTRYGEFPYMAALGWPSQFDGSIFYRCGGTLISPTFVLTAAHCINFGGQYPSMVRLGGENLTHGMGEDHAIRRVFMHPDYTDNDAYNDIALLELDGAQPSRRPIACLWADEKLPVRDLIAIGYGQIQFAGLSSSQLLKVELQHVSQEDCQPHYPAAELPKGLTSGQICAGDIKQIGDTCQGDSGGPLLMQSGPDFYAVGVTSLGQGCASGPPSVYTRVSSYVDWIESIVWPKSETPAPEPTFDLRISH